MVATPTLKAAQVVSDEVGVEAFSAAWLVHQHGFRWDTDGHWTRIPTAVTDERARLTWRDLLFIDEAGMLDQDTALALLTVADEAGARVAFAGDRHQLPAVGRGGVLDHAARWAQPEAVLTLETVHRFADPDYAALTLRMRSGEAPGEVFDALVARGQVVIHPTDVQRHAALTELGASGEPVIAQTHDQVNALNAAIHDHRSTDELTRRTWVSGMGHDHISVGDRVSTRRNDRDLQVANRDVWTVTAIDSDTGSIEVTGRHGSRTLPGLYVARSVQLAYATTVHGVQGDTLPTAHLLVSESTGAAAAYVAMTRGRRHNTAHLVAETLDDARAQWVEVFARDRADLGPRHAARKAVDDIDLYGPQARRRPAPQPTYQPPREEESWRVHERNRGHGNRQPGYGPSR